MQDEKTRRALEFIARCEDEAKLRQVAENARQAGLHDVWHAAQRRIFDVLPSARPGTVEHDVWRSIHALEAALTDERGKTTRLSRTRQKIGRDGEHKTVSDLVLGKASEGFRMLVERAMTDLTFEAVALRHAGAFDDEVIAEARRKLDEVGGLK